MNVFTNLLNSMNIQGEVLKIYTDLSKRVNGLALTYPYWEVDVREWDNDVMELFNRGQLVLNHRVTIDRIAIKIEDFKALKMESMKWYPDYMDIESTILDELYKASDTINDSGVVAPGFMFSLPCADGGAHYIVSKVNPKSIEYRSIRFGDAYVDRVLGIEGRLTLAKFKQITRFGRPTLADIFRKKN